VDWLRHNAALIQAVATILLVCITACFAWMTTRLAVALQEERELNRQAQLLAREKAVSELGAYAARLHRDVSAALDDRSTDAMTRMQKETWRVDRDHLEVAAAVVGGDPAQYAAVAGNALRAWVQVMNKRPRAANDDEANELWKESITRLQTARWALEQLLEARPAIVVAPVAAGSD
jgi:hypothetical protein